MKGIEWSGLGLREVNIAYSSSWSVILDMQRCPCVYFSGGSTATCEGQKEEDGAGLLSAPAVWSRGGAGGEPGPLETAGVFGAAGHQQRTQGASVERLRREQERLHRSVHTHRSLTFLQSTVSCYNLNRSS